MLDFDNEEHWSTTTIGQLESDIKIFMGPRWNSSNIKIENPVNTQDLIPYLTANAALELGVLLSNGSMVQKQMPNRKATWIC